MKKMKRKKRGVETLSERSELLLISELRTSPLEKFFILRTHRNYLCGVVRKPKVWNDLSGFN